MVRNEPSAAKSSHSGPGRTSGLEPPEEDIPAEIARLESEAQELRRQRDVALREVQRIRRSQAYRAGRAIAWLPRTTKTVIGRIRSRGAIASDTSGSLSTLGRPGAALNQPSRRFMSPEQDAVPYRVANPDVTVVIPVYNSELWIDDCLSSVLAQTGATLEVVCINDGSTDRSRDVMQKYADADPRVTIIDQPNSGQSVGRNVGLDAAAGRYLIYLDSDDYWPNDVLKSLVAHADEESLDVLLFDCVAFRDGEVEAETWARYENYYQRSYDYREVRPGDRLIADMRAHRDYRPHVGMYITRTDYVRSNGVRFIPGIVHQDNPYTFALLLGAERTAHVKADIYARRIRPGSTITTLSKASSAKGYFLSYVSMVREIEGHSADPKVTNLLCDVVHGVFDGAQKAAAQLPAASLEALRGLDDRPDAQLALRLLTSTRGRP